MAKNKTAAATETKRVRNTEEAFVTSYMKNKGDVAAIAKELGLSEGSVTVRKSNMKKIGKTLPDFGRRGGGAKAPSVEEFNALVAKLTQGEPDADVEKAAATLETAAV